MREQKRKFRLYISEDRLKTLTQRSSVLFHHTIKLVGKFFIFEMEWGMPMFRFIAISERRNITLVKSHVSFLTVGSPPILWNRLLKIYSGTVHLLP